ncbi:MAG: ATPase, complex, delta/epsilon subunit [Bacteroidetes bacterium]|nr:ATPase, complex, delta/epsilon subunit [Bacteroidota bacterium]
MKLDIVTPDQIYFSGEVTLVTLPGTKGSFTLLEHHAPFISSLGKGKVVYVAGGESKECMVNSGFVEMSNNAVTVCLETIEKD